MEILQRAEVPVVGLLWGKPSCASPSPESSVRYSGGSRSSAADTAPPLSSRTGQRDARKRFPPSDVWNGLGSAVVIRGIVIRGTTFGPTYAEAKGPGFLYGLGGMYVTVASFHVVGGAQKITVASSDGDSHAATVMGSDPDADLAVNSVAALHDEFHPPTTVSSDDLKVGDPVMAVGSHFLSRWLRYYGGGRPARKDDRGVHYGRIRHSRCCADKLLNFLAQEKGITCLWRAERGRAPSPQSPSHEAFSPFTAVA